MNRSHPNRRLALALAIGGVLLVSVAIIVTLGPNRATVPALLIVPVVGIYAFRTLSRGPAGFSRPSISRTTLVIAIAAMALLAVAVMLLVRADGG